MKYLRGNSVINSILKSIHEYLKNKRVDGTLRCIEVKLHEVQQLSSDFFFRSSTERRRAETFSGSHDDRDLDAFPAWRAGPAATL